MLRKVRNSQKPCDHYLSINYLIAIKDGSNAMKIRSSTYFIQYCLMVYQ